VCIYYLIR